MKAFSLIEVIVATSILSIAVFGVYRLIGENTKVLDNSDTYLDINLLFEDVKECLTYKGIDHFSTGSGYNININDCSTGSPDLFTINNKTYQIELNKISSGVDFISWEIIIDSSSVGKQKTSYLQKRQD